MSLTHAPVLAPLVAAIGGTPLVRLERFEPRAGVEIYAKLESRNPGGSVKDRAALAIILAAERSGQLGRGRILLDATSGNTGIAYAMIGAARGHRVRLCVPGNVTPERKRMLHAYGADLVFTDPMDGSDGAILEARRLHAAARDRVLLRRSVQQRRQLARPLRHDGRRNRRADRRTRDPLRRRPRHQRNVRRHGPPAA